MDFLETASRYFDPVALALVVGGTLAAAAMRSTREDLKRALVALRPLFTARPANDALTALRAVRHVEWLTELKGISCADHIDASNPFVRRASLRLVDAESADAFARWAADDISERQARHRAAADVWRAAADAAPAMGMIGSVIGLVGMFSAMNDPDTIGPSMALALLTTFYGLIIAAVIASPIASRLDRLSLAEREWQEGIATRLEALARAECVTTQQWLAKRSKAGQ